MKLIKKALVILMAAISVLSSMLLFVGCGKDEKNYTINDLFLENVLYGGFTTSVTNANVEFIGKINSFTKNDMPVALSDDKKTPVEDLAWGSALVFFATAKAKEVTVTKISYKSYRIMRNDEQDNGEKDESLIYAWKNRVDSTTTFSKTVTKELNINDAIIYPKGDYSLWTYDVSFDVSIKFEEEAMTKDGFPLNSTWDSYIKDTVSSLTIRSSRYSAISDVKIEFSYNK